MPNVKWILFTDNESNYSSSTSSRSTMNYIFSVVSFLVLEFLWKVQLAVEKYFKSNQKKLISTPSSSSPEPTPPNISTQPNKTTNFTKKKRKKKGLFFDPESGRRRSYLSLKDLISPAEEKMLMVLCAKGSSSSDSGAKTVDDTNENYEDYSDLLRAEHQIPRSKFTAIWVESCNGNE
nr:uncharacterized protein LOC111421325 [Onthophagus taurus]